MQRIEDLTARAQARHRQGRTLDAIRLYEDALEIRISLYGVSPSTPFSPVCGPGPFWGADPQWSPQTADPQWSHNWGPPRV